MRPQPQQHHPVSFVFSILCSLLCDFDIDLVKKMRLTSLHVLQRLASSVWIVLFTLFICTINFTNDLAVKFSAGQNLFQGAICFIQTANKYEQVWHTCPVLMILMKLLILSSIFCQLQIFCNQNIMNMLPFCDGVILFHYFQFPEFWSRMSLHKELSCPKLAILDFMTFMT